MSGLSFESLTIVDYVILGVIGISTIISFVRGFIREAISLATWVLAFWIAIKFAPQIANMLKHQIATPAFRAIVAFGTLFVGTIIVGAILNFLISTMVDKSGLSGTDRMLGMVFGITRGVLLVGILVLMANMTAVTRDNWYRSSTMIPQFTGLAHWLNGFLPNQFERLEHWVPQAQRFIPKDSSQR